MEYLVVHLNNLGWCGSSGMGITSLSFQEIQAYNDLTNAQLSPDEVLIIKKMSVAYVSQSNDKNPHKSPPYKHSPTD